MSGERVCGHCRSPVYDQDTLRCWQCGEMLGEQSGFISGMRYSKPKLIFIVCAVTVIVAFVLLIL